MIFSINHDGEQLWLKKTRLGYRVIHPIRNEDGSINWFNLTTGGWNNLLFVIATCIILLLISYSYAHDIKAVENNYKVISEDPIAFCKNVQCGDGSYLQNLSTGKINISIMNSLEHR